MGISSFGAIDLLLENQFKIGVFKQISCFFSDAFDLHVLLCGMPGNILRRTEVLHKFIEGLISYSGYAVAGDTALF
jgi:hypothetical protein